MTLELTAGRVPSSFDSRSVAAHATVNIRQWGIYEAGDGCQLEKEQTSPVHQDNRLCFQAFSHDYSPFLLRQI
jgi:hypothetical protein